MPTGSIHREDKPKLRPKLSTQKTQTGPTHTAQPGLAQQHQRRQTGTPQANKWSPINLLTALRTDCVSISPTVNPQSPHRTTVPPVAKQQIQNNPQPNNP